MDRHSTPSPDDHEVIVLRVGLALTGLTVTELWLAAVGVGGNLSRAEVEATVTGARRDAEHDVLAQALNDHLIGSDVAYRVPFRGELTTTSGDAHLGGVTPHTL